MSSPRLPPGWVQANDPSSGRVYYANPTTQETRWDPPPLPPPSASVGTDSYGEGTSSSSSRKDPEGSGNPLYSSEKKNVAYENPSKLVSMARNMLGKATAFPEETTTSDLELHSITPGQIADLCRLQQLSATTGKNQAYTPLNPYRILTSSKVQDVEQARLDARMRSLKERLEEFGGARAEE